MPNLNVTQSARAKLDTVKSDFDTVKPSVADFYTDSTNTVGMTHGAILSALQSWNATPANLAEATTNLNALAAMVGLLTVIVAWLLKRELARSD